ncbi:MAG: glutamyl-tRNA reductase [Planctomycetia bacterium]|jgi:glutamyl-tRNA reductase
MQFRVIGCSHHETPIALRERIAFSATQTQAALEMLREVQPELEVVLLSTCNRVEFYLAGRADFLPNREAIARFIAQFYKIDADEVFDHLTERTGRDAIEHLFTVTSSLDSMVVGEPQILSQVKEAYQLASEIDATGPITHTAFQAAIRTARRVAGETELHRHRVSIPSIAVANFARRVFERFDDKQVLVIGAGEMADETLRYLKDEGARLVTVVNRRYDRAVELADHLGGKAEPWEQLLDLVAQADLIISTTGSELPVVTRDDFRQVEATREAGPLFILDLAVPRDFDPQIADCADVFLYSIDDLEAACEANRKARQATLPAAEQIVAEESGRFEAEARHRATGPVITRLREEWEKPKEEELARLLGKLPNLDKESEAEIRYAFDRLVNKLLHPPLESLRTEATHSMPWNLIEALTKLFKLKD